MADIRAGIEILLEASAPEAAVDSEERQYAPSCFPGTREQYIEDITSWATGPTDEHSPSIYWMRGPAGVGKSAIAQTCAQKVKHVDQLGAAYFFTVGKHNDSARFFTTIAYQLSTIFPGYREILDDKVRRDRTLVKKTLASQFRSLITEPLRDSQSRGLKIPRRAIFIDGLDECQDQDKQREIIEIIASSVHDPCTPFRWAIFSRPEPQIVSAFTQASISPLCRVVWLPISREIDGEIELYLKGGFENILRRRNISLSSPWPADGVIRTLVEASDGLFAYPAAVLRFIDRYPSLRLQEPLQEILSVITEGKSRSRSPSSPFAELDAFYLLIMRRIPEHIFPTVQLFLLDIVSSGSRGNFGALMNNRLGLSETEFRGIYNHLHAVLVFEDPPKPLLFDRSIDVSRSFYEQNLSTDYNPIHYNRPHEAGGMSWFHHKSFYDFLVDPSRSASFCPSAAAIRELQFERYVQTQQEYAGSFVICNSRMFPDLNVESFSYQLITGLALAPNFHSSSTSLAWSQGNEYIDSFIKTWVFTQTSVDLSHNGQPLVEFLEQVSQPLLRKLADLDYRKYLLAELEVTGQGYWQGHSILGTRGDVRIIPGTMLSCLGPSKFKTFNSIAFLKVSIAHFPSLVRFLMRLQAVKQLEKLGVIKAYHPKLPSSLASIRASISRQSRQGQPITGQYKLGHGDKAIYWYWEFDTERQYFHQFDTLNFMEAVEFYQAEKFNFWMPPRLSST